MEETKKPASRKLNRPVLIIIIATVLLAFAAIVIFLFINKAQSPLPSKVIKSANFAVYYPSQLPAGYKYDKNSVSYDDNILFFTISNGSKKISISEQAAPITPPNFDIIQKSNTSFKKLDLINGNAIYGVSQSIPVAILLTNTSLVNINGSKNTPIDVIAKTAQNMSSSF